MQPTSLAQHWARDWRALALTQVHHGKRICAAYQLPQCMFYSSFFWFSGRPALAARKSGILVLTRRETVRVHDPPHKEIQPTQWHETARPAPRWRNRNKNMVKRGGRPSEPPRPELRFTDGRPAAPTGGAEALRGDRATLESSPLEPPLQQGEWLVALEPQRHAVCAECSWLPGASSKQGLPARRPKRRSKRECSGPSPRLRLRAQRQS